MNWLKEWNWKTYHFWHRSSWCDRFVCLFRGHRWVRVINFHGQPVTFCGRCMKRRES